LHPITQITKREKTTNSTIKAHTTMGRKCKQQEKNINKKKKAHITIICSFKKSTSVFTFLK
jgi:hypothetical protein